MSGRLGSRVDVVAGQAGGVTVCCGFLSFRLRSESQSLPPMATTTPTDELPGMAVQDQIDDLLDTIAKLTAESKRIEAELADAKDALTDFFAAGEVDQSFQHNDWQFTYTRGRTTYQYSDEAKKAIAQLQEADKAMGRAIQKTGASFWTVKPPAI